MDPSRRTLTNIFTDAPRLSVRLATTPAILETELGVSAPDLTFAIRRFRALKLLPTPLDLVRNSDRFKAVLLYAVCRAQKPDIVIETGVASGNSSRAILLAMEDVGRGHLYSVDLPEATYVTSGGRPWTDPLAGQPTGWLVPASLRSRWTLCVGPSVELLTQVTAEAGNVDLFYHDSEHTKQNMLFEFRTVWPQIRAGGVLLADNVDWSDAFPQFAREVGLTGRIVYPYLGVLTKRLDLRGGRADELHVAPT